MTFYFKCAGPACGGGYICTSSMISAYWALTAGHCTDDDENFYGGQLGVGNYDYGQSDPYPIERVMTHPNYREGVIGHDVGLVILRNPITIWDPTYVMQVFLTNTGDYPAGTEVTVSGWGLTRDGGNTPNRAEWIDHVLDDRSHCIDEYGTAFVGLDYCIDSDLGGTCSGDSGGPLVIRGTVEQIGVTSFGASAGCEAGWDDAFTNVGQHRQWITDTCKNFDATKSCDDLLIAP